MEIENYQETLPGTPIIAVFDLRLGNGMTIHQCRVIRSKKGKLFPVLPSVMVMGEKKFIPVISLSMDKEAEFKKALNDAIEPFITNRCT